jgi:hypothetical protein
VARHGQQAARPGDIGGAIAVGEHAVMADAMDALGGARASGSGG